MGLKKCRKCNEDKPTDCFFKDRSSKDGLHPWCKDCCEKRRQLRLSLESADEQAARKKRERERAAGKRSLYTTICASCKTTFISKHKRRIYCSSKCRGIGTAEQKLSRNTYSLAKMRKVQEWLDKYKAEKGCVDCGYNSHPEALQFDHEGVKSRSITSLRHSIEQIKDEIEKGQCVVRCANCHAVITRRRKAITRK